MARISRRECIKGLSAAAILAGCSATPGSSFSTVNNPLTLVKDNLGISLVGLHPNNGTIVANGIEQRVPFAVIETDTFLVADDAVLNVSVVKDGDPMSAAQELTVKAHLVEHDHVGVSENEAHEHSDISRYFPLRVAISSPGIYTATVHGDVQASYNFQAFSVEDAIGVPVGAAMGNVPTPTDGSGEARKDFRGVDTICSAPEPCGLHGVSLDAVLGVEPCVLLVATPAFCSTAYCGPVLETLLSVGGKFPSVIAIHAEVYSNAVAVGGDYGDPNIRRADHMRALNLDYEPAAFFINRNGIVVERLDSVFNQAELEAAISVLV